MDTQSKQKVTVTLSTDIVRALDAQARAAGGSRSAILARVLDEWQSQAAQVSDAAARLEADTAAFYQAQSNAEQGEDDAWAACAAQAAASAWDAH